MDEQVILVTLNYRVAGLGKNLNTYEFRVLNQIEAKLLNVLFNSRISKHRRQYCAREYGVKIHLFNLYEFI